jgi:hypothetical protein
MLAFIQFSSQFAWWSAFTFWIVIVSIVITLGFTLVVFSAGIGDLRFLITSMDEPPESPDEALP